MDNLDFILSLFNQYLFQDAKNNIESLKYYVNTNPSTKDNKLVLELVRAIDDYTLDSIDKPLFSSILARCSKSEAESRDILQRVMTWKGYDRNQISPASKYFKDVVSASVIQRANQLYPNAPSEYIKYLKDVNLNINDSDFFTSTKFQNIDINSVIADSNIGAAKTGSDWINSLWPTYRGIPFGQLVTISAPPGVGKSLFAMDLAAYFAATGYKTLYVALGDLNWLDFITRLAAIVFKVPFDYAYDNLGSMYEQLSGIIGNNLEISINPAGTVTADDIVNKTMNENFDIVFVDYDGNLSMGGDDDSMYSSFGDVYAKFTKLSIEQKLCFILSQPKVNKYTGIIGMADIGESSRKQQTVDCIFTISDNSPNCPNGLYVLQCCKNRRGRQGRIYVIRIEGKFIEIPKSIYDALASVTEEKNYKLNDIEVLIHQANVSSYAINQSMNNAQQPQQQPQQKTQAQRFGNNGPFQSSN